MTTTLHFPLLNCRRLMSSATVLLMFITLLSRLSAQSDKPSAEVADLSIVTEGQSVRIRWRTTSETDNAGFSIWRSTNDTTMWTPIATYITTDDLIGLGTSTTGRDYVFTDRTKVYPIDWTTEVVS